MNQARMSNTYVFDTEFIENGPDEPIRLISIGMVCVEDEREYYAELEGVPWEFASPWVLQNVQPHLLGGEYRKSRSQIAWDLKSFVHTFPERPSFWAYYCSYDWVVLCQIFGAMIDLPKQWPMYCHDLKDLLDRRGYKPHELPKQQGIHHNALEDARWNLELYRFLTKPLSAV